MLFRDTRLGGDFRENEGCEENGYLYGVRFQNRKKKLLIKFQLELKS